LHAEGYRTTYGQPLQAKHIWYLRGQWGLANIKEGGLRPDRLRWEDGAYTIQGVVQAIGVTKDTVHTWLKQGRLTGTQLGPYMPWRIQLTAEQMHTLQQRAKQARLKPKRQGTLCPQLEAVPAATSTP